MKRLTKSIALFLTVILLVITSGPFIMNANLNDISNDIPEEIYLAMKLQESALNAYQRLWDFFEKNESGEPIYPDEYAGEYIEGDKLVILLTDLSPDMITKYSDVCKDSTHVIFEKAEYSLKYLNSLKQYTNKLKADGIKLVSYGVDHRNNCLQINIANNDSIMNKRVIDSYINELPINIEISEEVEACALILGGSGITNDDRIDPITISVGICGWLNGKDAILTCGHGNEKLSVLYGNRYPYIKYNGIRTGQVSYQRANTTPGVFSLGDFAIVTLTGSDTMTNVVKGSGVSITGTNSSVPIGGIVYKYGNTTGYSYGTVQQIEFTAIYWLSPYTYEVSGLIEAYMNTNGTHAVAEGDSGGTVYQQIGNNYMFCGIVTAREIILEGQLARKMYFTPAFYTTYNTGFTVKTTP